MTAPILRFAPSPNGHLHLGHAYSALMTYDWARQMGGTFLLRIEDIDVTRCKPEFTADIFDDLKWLGLKWPTPAMVQSKRFAHYRDAAEKLEQLGLLYPCFCSRADIKQTATETDPDGAPLYPGTCKHLSVEQIREKLKADQPFSLRLNTARASAMAGMLTFSQSQPTPMDRPQIKYANPNRWGDAIIVRKDIPTSYHLSVVVDDAAQEITNVTRGRDMQAATDLHVLLQFLLGLPTPTYTFHKLILDDDGGKLAKTKASTSLKDLREQGWTAADIRKALGLT